MPLPTLLCLAVASGIAAALAGRSELRVSPRPAVLTRAFAAYLLFAGLLLVPATVYFYVFHGDWFLMYTVDVRRIPSAVALLGFGLELGLAAGGFALGAAAVRNQRDGLGAGLAGALLLAALVVVPVAADRLGVVGSHAQYIGGFGLQSYGGGPLMQGAIAVSAILLAGFAYLVARLLAMSRRGS